MSLKRSDPSAKRKSYLKAPAIGCLTVGCLLPLICVLGGICIKAGPGFIVHWFPEYIIFWVLPITIFLAPIGTLLGFLINAFKGTNVALSNIELAAELKSMSTKSLLEYKALCSQNSRQYKFADMEINRRNESSKDSSFNKP